MTTTRNDAGFTISLIRERERERERGQTFSYDCFFVTSESVSSLPRAYHVLHEPPSPDTLRVSRDTSLSDHGAPQWQQQSQASTGPRAEQGAPKGQQQCQAAKGPTVSVSEVAALRVEMRRTVDTRLQTIGDLRRRIEALEREREVQHLRRR